MTSGMRMTQYYTKYYLNDGTEVNEEVFGDDYRCISNGILRQNAPDRVDVPHDEDSVTMFLYSDDTLTKQIGYFISYRLGTDIPWHRDDA